MSILSPGSEAELSAILVDAHALHTPVSLRGGATRLCTDGPAATRISSQALRGIVTYEPGELTLIVRSGTPVAEVEAALAAEGQMLSFEPLDHRLALGTTGTPTIGGMVATNASGPRRLQAGACRDLVLGARFVDGQGRILKSGGRVMKNVTGMDLGKLLAGSHGTLGMLTEVSLKTLPLPETELTLSFPQTSAADAQAIFAEGLATPYEISGAAWVDGTTHLRIEGLEAQVTYRRDRLSPLFKARQLQVISADESRALWLSIRNLGHLGAPDAPLWRISTQGTRAPALIEALRVHGGQVSMDWGGALIWYRGNAPASVIRAAAGDSPALRLHGPSDSASDGPAFPPEPALLAAISAKVRRVFDPAGILNPGLMER